MRHRRLLTVLLVVLLGATACAPGGEATGTEAEPIETGRSLRIGGIPDQDVAHLSAQFGEMASYLSEQLEIDVEYVPSTSYAAVVTAFGRGDIDLAWLGGLTGVQAREAREGAEAIAQRPRDAEFHSKFVVGADVDAETLEDLEGLSFTFGSESSTSGHLMPRFFLAEAGITPEEDFESVNYSGSHDRTYTLVEAGSFDAGALNEAVWEQAVDEGKVDTDKARVLLTTPAYYDYNWTAAPTIDRRFGEGTTNKIVEALTALDPNKHGELLELWQADGFIRTETTNYDTIRQVARDLDILRVGGEG